MMFFIKVAITTRVTLLAAVLLLLSSPVPAQEPNTPPGGNPVPDKLKSQLMVIANEALTTQHRISVNGDVEASLRGAASPHLFKDAMQDEFAKQVAMRSKLKLTKQDSKSFKMNLRVTESWLHGDKATLKLTEHTVVGLAAPGGPSSWEYRDHHLFEFTKARQGWKLSKATKLRPTPAPWNKEQPPPEDMYPLSNPLRDAPPDDQVDGV